MNNNRNLEYVFWLKGWRDTSSYWPKYGHFECIVTREKMRIVPTENDPDKELNLNLSQVRECKIYTVSKNPNRGIELILPDRKIMLFPVHPFDPSPIFFAVYKNHNETPALKAVIDAFRSNATIKINANPYLRQLATKDNLKRFKMLGLQWDAHTTPWYYHDLYGDKLLWLKTIGVIIASSIIVVTVILAIAYVLDNLNII